MASTRQRKPLAEGARAPEFRLARLDGGESTLQDLIANGPVLLVFFKVTCPVCQFAFPFFERLHQPGTLPVYGVCQNDAEDTRDFNRRFGITFPTLLDSEDDGYPASNGFGISTVPTAFLIERDGTISRVMEGWQKKQIEWLGGKAGVNPFRPGEYVPEWKAG
jgi:peroxiredoxin